MLPQVSRSWVIICFHLLSTPIRFFFLLRTESPVGYPRPTFASLDTGQPFLLSSHFSQRKETTKMGSGKTWNLEVTSTWGRNPPTTHEVAEPRPDYVRAQYHSSKSWKRTTWPPNQLLGAQVKKKKLITEHKGPRSITSWLEETDRGTTDDDHSVMESATDSLDFDVESVLLNPGTKIVDQKLRVKRKQRKRYSRPNRPTGMHKPFYREWARSGQKTWPTGTRGSLRSMRRKPTNMKLILRWQLWRKE